MARDPEFLFHRRGADLVGQHSPGQTPAPRAAVIAAAFVLQLSDAESTSCWCFEWD